MSPTMTRQVARNRARARARRRNRRPSALVVVLIVIAALGGVATFLSRGGGPQVGDQTAPVSIEGDALPEFDEGFDDAVGMTAPRLDGRDFDGERVSVAYDRPTALVFLAHSCSHCQSEVRAMRDWFDDPGVPDGVELVAVSTLVDPGQGNYPPETWLEREAWQAPVLLDDASSSAADAFGLTGTPFWVFVNGDGTVLARHAGSLPLGDLDAILATLAA